MIFFSFDLHNAVLKTRLNNQNKGKVHISTYFRRIRLNIMFGLPLWVSSFLVGVFAVLYARLFDYFSKISYLLFHQNKLYLFVVTPACFVAAWLVVKIFDKYAAGSGIPQVMASVELTSPKSKFIVDKILSLKCILVKVISSLIMVFGGGAIGREGPTVQISASIFYLVSKWLPARWIRVSHNNMILTGAAAGLAAAFNTPLGGVVFAIEELSKTHFSRYKTAVFTSVIIAGLTAQAFIGPYLYIGYPKVPSKSINLIFYVILVALVCGALGSLLSNAIIFLTQFRRKLEGRKTEVLYVIVAALSMAFIAYNYGHMSVLGSGKREMTNLLFTEHKTVDWELPLYRIYGPLASFTTGAAGGIFAPSLSAGATIGATMAEWFQLASSDINLLILVGMAAFLTGITHSPFTSAILVFEMTDEHQLIFMLMLSGIVSSLAALAVNRRSLYDRIKEQYIITAKEDAAIKTD